MVRVAQRFAAGEGKLRNHAILPNDRQAGRAERRGRAGAHDDAVVVGTVRNAVAAAGQVRQADEAAALGPGERLGSAALKRAADGDPRSRHTKTLRGGVAFLNDADIENLILRSGGGRRRDNDPCDEGGNLGKCSHDPTMLNERRHARISSPQAVGRGR